MRFLWGVVGLLAVACGEDAYEPPKGAPLPAATPRPTHATLATTTYALDGSSSEHSVVRALAVGRVKDDVYVVFERRGNGASALMLARFDTVARTFRRPIALAAPSATPARALQAEVLASGRVVVTFDAVTGSTATYRAIVSDGDTVTSAADLATYPVGERISVAVHASPAADDGLVIVTRFTSSVTSERIVRTSAIVGAAFRPAMERTDAGDEEVVAFSPKGIGLVCSSSLRGCQRLRNGVLEPFVTLEGGPGCFFRPVAVVWAPTRESAVVSGTCSNGKVGLAYVDQLGGAVSFDVPDDAVSGGGRFAYQSLLLSDDGRGTLTLTRDNAFSVMTFDALGPGITTQFELANAFSAPPATRLAPDGRPFVLLPASDHRGLAQARSFDGKQFVDAAFPSKRQNPDALHRAWQAAVLATGSLFAIDVQLRHREGSGAFDAFGLAIGAATPSAIASLSFGPEPAAEEPSPDMDGATQPSVSLLSLRRTDAVYLVVPGAVEEHVSPFPAAYDRGSLAYLPETRHSLSAIPRAIMKVDPLTGALSETRAPCARAAMLPVADRPILACETPDRGIGIVLPE